ncbi:EAL domain-containing protein [Pseudomonas fragi]|uniref:EAL domain-containing response regulator n=1 Tax=Pseudomonas fragi TaxID=296 RepID=UPI000879AAB5|nr:EAL domain-containing response regulator [Pseudomonas fragi]MDE4513733.1 EAL domain-containing protein [Pseudomonas fragi]NNA87150.1 EAL domain-containing protein [Pseudomonas fragi]NNB10740.1 EAL domain-containing protein [Pseudomonas fragi]NNB41151.1 EAL domain-containing protein [Pseudomonas fragi]NNB56825.1 EAL domain-containing protein [Pseudomonas fragi]
MPGSSLRILILEDDSFQRAVAVRMFRSLGCHEVFEAADGSQALALLQQVGAVDIAVCDLQMEGVDGLAFLRRAGQSGQIGAVLLSSALSADLRRAAQQVIALLGLQLLGDVGKPLPAKELQALLDKYRGSCIRATSPDAVVRPACEDEVRQALALQQLQAWYQPKFNLRSGEVCGVEVLCRWMHPSKGVLPPALFIPVLERCGLMDELLFAQLDQALSLQEQARIQGYPLNMAFNLQTSQLANSQLTYTLKGILARHGTPGSRLTFELTENGLLQAPAASLENLVRLRMMGCRLSLDDFGAGFSSLQRLCQLPFNEIKLDGEFVRNLEHEPRCAAVIASTLALGNSLGMAVVVEGIETLDQLQRLLAMGCVEGQGYWFARPMSGQGLLHWLQQRETNPVAVSV